MVEKIYVYVLLLIVARLLPQKLVNIHTLHKNDSNKEPEVIDSSKPNEVSLKLAKPIILEKMRNGVNSVLSPLTVQILLAMSAAGCKGATKDQLLSFLNFNNVDELGSCFARCVASVLTQGSSSGGPVLSCGVWIDRSLSFNPHFKAVIDDVYKAHSTRVDFQNLAARELNEWFGKETRGLINSVISPNEINKLTRLILANALYFKGTWEKKFDASKTKEHEFYLLNGSTVKAPFLTSGESQYISAYEGFKVLRLPYKQGNETHRNFSMYYYLPDAKDGLPNLVEKVCSQPEFLKNHTPQTKVSVGKFLIPKFKMSFDFEASKFLKDVGLVLPFIESLDGEFTNMVDSPAVSRELYISKIFQNCFIEVDEEGTKAVLKHT
ncbi:OLC1v1018893C1 [Oldenlandia corymbosa var. corymbosa]|uniref:OLC1v1018893C1 n=1 Tax=Oldenlandia corymbosa var. corymbosa TaxID=529605 RepID=A0AAV1ECR1_OLDCO|nr:OLC1v1018893C1 [Oldenlandia corymbosa var. corymbosa]